ncbi:structural protein [Cellulophaga phage phi48:2]|uniref:structural protein n=1 Tax=Cellulophaga phage phi48:2 TaxID=1327968 RepID=UPI000351B4EC|nr:structural protein [Cellulophaga phage phi48:2]AGO47274.1 structural protein [Cellulophaga phage phi48:2]
MEGKIFVQNKDIEVFKSVCEDRFNGTYIIKKKLLMGFLIKVSCDDLQDIFSLGQIFNEEVIINKFAKYVK